MLVLIHGLGGSSHEMAPFARLPGPSLATVSPTLLSHGDRPLADVGGFDAIVEDLLAQLPAPSTGPVFLLGHSLGGYLALYLASLHRERVRGVIAIGAKIFHDSAAVEHIRHILSPQRTSPAARQRQQAQLEKYGADELARRSARALAIYERIRDDPPITEADLRALRLPVLLISGEDDPLASGAEMRRVAGLLPNAQLGLFAGRAHPIANIPMDPVVSLVRRFIQEVEGERFTASGAIDLSPRLVTGGMADGDVNVTIGRARD